MTIKQTLKVVLCHISPKILSEYLYYKSRGKRINLKNPQLFDEKLTWIKLNDYHNNSLVWKCCDKYYMREYAKEVGISDVNLVPLIGVYDKAEEIDFDSLPGKFALKCSHGCGFNIICTNKDDINFEDVKRKLSKWQKTKYGYETAELQYNHIKPKIICEEYIEGYSTLPYDYKVYCFNGIAKCILVCSEREDELKLNFFDLDWNELPLGKKELRNEKQINKPSHFDDMIEIAEKISKKFPFVRVDFYEYKNKAIIGELTFTPAACVASYYSEYGEEYLGEFLKIDDYYKKKAKK